MTKSYGQLEVKAVQHRRARFVLALILGWTVALGTARAAPTGQNTDRPNAAGSSDWRKGLPRPVAPQATDTIVRNLATWSNELRAARVACSRHEDRARRLGDAESHLAMARCYLNGKGRRRSSLGALRHFRAAAHLGSAEGHYGIGLIYADGLVVRRDRLRALRHFRIAAELGFGDAMIEYGLALDLRDNTSATRKTACDWFARAAGSEVSASPTRASAHRFLGDCFAKGQGRKRDASAATHHYRLSARGGDLLARQILLGATFDGPAARLVRATGCRRLMARAKRRDPKAMRAYTRCMRFARTLPRR
ncbi:MAG: tetratricopeptide repeat protein [Pseudomonadota bacterium]